MYIRTKNNRIICTVRVGLEDYYTDIREATNAECIEALRCIPLSEISDNPAAFQALAIGIARGAWSVVELPAYQS